MHKRCFKAIIARTAISARDAASEESTPEAKASRAKIVQLFKDIEANLPTPVRETDKPFLLQV